MVLRKMWTRLQGPEDGGTPAPAGGAAPAAPATPAAPAAPTAAPAASGDSGSNSGGDPVDAFDFGSLSLPDAPDTGGDPVPTPEPVPAAPASTPAPPAQPPAPAPTPPAPAAPAAPAEPPAAPQPGATANQPASPAQPAQQVDWEKHRAEFMPQIEKMYALSDQEVQDFQTNPGQALPKLAAQLHYNVSMSLQAAIQQLLPQAIEGQLQLSTLRQKHETAFYGKWPALKKAVDADPKVEKEINDTIKIFSQTNKGASIEEVIQKVGLLVCLARGIDPTQGAPAGGGGPPPAPVAPAIIPGRPAGTGAQGHVPARLPGAAPGEPSEAEFFGELADYHLRGGG